ncbi:MAG: aminotransferase [Candidatus Bathyarchaeota archaeon]|nr:MAG: aminotransferase [Candidatus Bathyarchaeota archaeon]
MKIDPFLVEQYMNTYEHHVQLNLAETCVDPFTLHEFLTLAREEDFFEKIAGKKLTYGFIEGSQDLRKRIAELYDDANPDNVLVTRGAIDANFLVFYSLVEAGDTVISVFPSYQQLYSIPKSFGANVKLLKLRKENQWLPDLKELGRLIDEKTKLIVINNPHNPTGSLIKTRLLKKICTIAEDSEAFLLCDESYRGLYVRPEDSTPSAADLSKKAIVTGSLSKSFSLAGLRLGWINANQEIRDDCMLHRDYTTISCNMITDALASLAFKHSSRILKRNLNIIRTNHRILSQWVDDEPLIEWIPPIAGSTAFLHYNLPIPSMDFCVHLIREQGVFLVPGTCFEMEKYLRISYGCKTKIVEEGLSRISTFLRQSPTGH